VGGPSFDLRPISTGCLSASFPAGLPLIEIPSALAFRSIVLTDALNFAAIFDAVAPFTAIAINSRSFFQVNRRDLRLPTIPTISLLWL